MERMLERLDSAASTLVPLLYLAGLMTGVAAYFAGITLDMGLAVGVSLAGAAELHSFLQQRRFRASYAQFARLADDAPEREMVWRQVWVNGAILAGLLIFSAYNAVAFVASTWTPTPGFLPAPVQIGIRGLIIPALFFASGFLTPLYVDASDQLRATSAEMLRRTLKAIGKQWKTRLDQAQRRHADLAPIAVALLQDVGDEAGARRVELIAAGLGMTEGAARVSISAPASVVESAPPAVPQDMPESPDDDPGGGVPQETVKRPSRANSQRGKGLLTPFTGNRNPRRVSASTEDARRKRAYAYLDAQPGMTKTALRGKLRCRQNKANGYWMDWHAAQSTRETQAAG